MAGATPDAVEAAHPPAPRAALVLLAAGSGSRLRQHTNKVLLPLAGRPVLSWSLNSARKVPTIGRILLVIAERDRTEAEAVLAGEASDAGVELVVGGMTRHQSEWAALQHLAAGIEGGAIDIVVIHDAARPLAETSLFAEVVETAHTGGGAVPVRPQAGLVPVDPEREVPEVVAVQTPQGFRAGPLLRAYRQAAATGFVGTDTAGCVEKFTDLSVRSVRGSAVNIKITFPEDLAVAEHLMSGRPGFADHAAT